MISTITAGLYQTGTPVVTTSYESIATVTVGSGGSSSISFSSIPSTYKHLQIRAMVLSGAAGASSIIRFNGDTGANYRNHILYGTGSAVNPGNNATPYAPIFQGSSTAPSVMVLDILDYANTNKYKVTRDLDGYNANGSGALALNSNLWVNTAAITSIDITVSSGTFSQYSSFALYGIKG